MIRPPSAHGGAGGGARAGGGGAGWQGADAHEVAEGEGHVRDASGRHVFEAVQRLRRVVGVGALEALPEEVHPFLEDSRAGRGDNAGGQQRQRGAAEPHQDPSVRGVERPRPFAIGCRRRALGSSPQGKFNCLPPQQRGFKSPFRAGAAGPCRSVVARQRKPGTAISRLI